MVNVFTPFVYFEKQSTFHPQLGGVAQSCYHLEMRRVHHLMSSFTYLVSNRASAMYVYFSRPYFLHSTFRENRNIFMYQQSVITLCPL